MAAAAASNAAWYRFAEVEDNDNSLIVSSPLSAVSDELPDSSPQRPEDEEADDR